MKTQELKPTIDIAFKKLFGVEENKDLLISLINSIVDKEDQVTEIELLNPYTPSAIQTSKKIPVLDIKAKRRRDGARFNIEMQMHGSKHYINRAIYYWAKLHGNQLDMGDDYDTLRPTVGIHIMDFVCMSDPSYVNRYVIKNNETNTTTFDHFNMYTIELPKFSSKDTPLDNLMKNIKTSLDRWITFLSKYELLKQDKEHFPDKLDKDVSIKKAFDLMSIMVLSPEEQELYEERLESLRLAKSILEQKYDDGKAEGEEIGLEKGEEIGLEKGVGIGIEKGVVKTIKEMLKNGI